MSLAHCPTCDLWLRPADACLHLPPATATSAGTCEPGAVEHTPTGAGSLFSDAIAAAAAGQSRFDTGEAATNSGPFGPVPFHHASELPRV